MVWDSYIQQCFNSQIVSHSLFLHWLVTAASNAVELPSFDFDFLTGEPLPLAVTCPAAPPPPTALPEDEEELATVALMEASWVFLPRPPRLPLPRPPPVPW